MRRLALVPIAIAIGCAPPPEEQEEWTEAERTRILALSPVPPPPPDETNRWADDPAAARFGQLLFFDARLSANGELSCASCHDPERAFTDGRAVAEGLGAGTRNTPTVLGAAHQRFFFWDGRVDSAWAQALQPIENPIEMGLGREGLARAIADVEDLREEYEAVFGPIGERSADEVAVHAAKSLAAYGRRLATGRSPFDRFVEGVRTDDRGAQEALSPSAKRGLRLFLGEAGCRSCHSGPLLSDGEFHDIGIPPPGGGRPNDPARYEGFARLVDDPLNAAGPHSDDTGGRRALRLRTIVRRPEDWGAFRTPSLRNVGATAPYMHAGQMATLREVVEYYSTLEGAVLAGHHRELVLQPLELSDDEIDDLVAFLESLTDGPLDASLTRRP